MLFVWLFLFFLCWGSFLNVVAYRLTYDKPFLTARSYCPECSKTIAWYDNIPVISWLLLRGACRTCKKPISVLYPFVELLSGLLFTVLFFFLYTGSYDIIFVIRFITYFIFFSALVVATRTDLQAMVIPQVASIWLVPAGILAAFAGASHVTVLESVIGFFFGYGILWGVGALFKYLAKKDGIGVGDMELLSMIGTFLGPIGAWFSLLLGSLVGILLGAYYLHCTKGGRNTRIPFGPFLALGATIFFFFRQYLMVLLF